MIHDANKTKRNERALYTVVHLIYYAKRCLCRVTMAVSAETVSPFVAIKRSVAIAKGIGLRGAPFGAAAAVARRRAGVVFLAFVHEGEDTGDSGLLGIPIFPRKSPTSIAERISSHLFPEGASELPWLKSTVFKTGI